jgi:predicted TIM-barrel fold metal-dependent hydrolase
MEITLNSLDRNYQEKILDFLPQKIFDLHTHIGLPKHVSELSEERQKTTFASEASSHSFREREDAFKILLPGKKIQYVSFPFCFKEVDIDEANEYVLQKKYPFILGDLENPENTLELLDKNEVKGLKVYYDFVKKDYKDIRISDFVIDIFLEALEKSEKILMLHVPRSSLNEKENIEDLINICRKFKKTKIILAHMGRCYAKDDLTKSLTFLKNFPNIFMDFSTVSSQKIFTEGFKILGTKRILYGSDSPYSNTKGKIMDVPGIMKNAFITEKEFPWTKPELRKWYLDNKPPLTFLIYHQLEEMRLCSKKLKFSKENLEDIFYKNAAKLLNIQEL